METRHREQIQHRDRTNPQHARDEFWDRHARESEGVALPDPYGRDRAFHAESYTDEEPQAILQEMMEAGWTVSDALIAEAARETGRVDEVELRQQRALVLDRLARDGWANPEVLVTAHAELPALHRDDLTMTQDEWADCNASLDDIGALRQEDGRELDE